MLKWSILELYKLKDSPLHFEEVVSVEKDLQARDSEIIHATPFNVVGDIQLDGNLILVDFHLAGQLTVPSTRSLEPVIFPIDENINEVYTKADQDLPDLDKNTIVLVLENDVLDLKPAILDNILLSLPMQILSEAELNNEPLPKGEDWEVISESDYLAQKAEDEPADSKFSALKDYFPNEDSSK